jgi:hypothetical protein
VSVKLVNPYCSVAQVQRYLNDQRAEQADRIADGINDASRTIDDWTQWIFYRKEYTAQAVLPEFGGPGNFIVKPSGRANGYIKCPFKPIISVTSIVDTKSANAVLVEGIDYSVDYLNGIITSIPGAFFQDPGRYQITCVLGLDNGTADPLHTPDPIPYDSSIPSADIPGEIHRSAIQIAAIFSGMYKKEIVTKGDAMPVTLNITEVPEAIERKLRIWSVRSNA